MAEMKLTIKRVPTVLSNYQEDGKSETVGCGRSCLGKCCFPVSNFPLYEFKKDTQKHEKGSAVAGKNSPIDFLNTLVLGQWEDRMAQGMFRYDVTACETKIIPGNHGFIAQLNEGRHLQKRPTEFRVDCVLQNFDSKKFNFTKVGQKEVLFRFEPSDGEPRYFEDAKVSPDSSGNVLAINVSPIEYGHVLLIPRVLDCLSQKIDSESFLLAVHMASEAASPYFRLGYNSLGAFATINHLHFQAYYLSVAFPVEKSPTKPISISKSSNKSIGVTVSQLFGYPVRGLVFEGGNTLRDISDMVSAACICLQETNIPFNVLISDSGRRIFIFPQCYAEKQALGEVSQEILDTQVNPAVWEISGHIVLKRKKDFEETSEVHASRLLSEVSLSEERFDEVKSYIFEALGLVAAVDVDEDEVTPGMNNGGAFLSRSSSHITTPFPEGCLVLQ
ncbi:GDP-L-galactose phosphorylase [Zostera marina]|uniref:GDP-D-glucose phosphorylase 1 n=1 Tax=Zostera marina TaxID=29655 RepID=A0A0K9PIA7_ZOSMR|nr:GDP-L-galactose phosphorylase [Zostera marina]